MPQFSRRRFILNFTYFAGALSLSQKNFTNMLGPNEASKVWVSRRYFSKKSRFFNMNTFITQRNKMLPPDRLFQITQTMKNSGRILEVNHKKTDHYFEINILFDRLSSFNEYHLALKEAADLKIAHASDFYLVENTTYT